MWIIIKYIKHILKSFHPKGAGIHSPFIFKLVTQIINNNNKYSCYKSIEIERKRLLKTNKTIDIIDYGTGNNNKRKIKSIAKYSLKQKKQAQLIFRLIKYFSPNNSLEIGTSFGITTCYIAKAAPNSSVITLEGCPKTAQISQEIFKNLNINNIIQYTGKFDSILPNTLSRIQNLDFVFFDGNHTKNATISYFNQCLPFINNNTIFIFDDIYYSKEMLQSWNIIKKNQKVTVTIDMFHLGIVLFKKELSKQNFYIHI